MRKLGLNGRRASAQGEDCLADTSANARGVLPATGHRARAGIAPAVEPVNLGLDTNVLPYQMFIMCIFLI